MKQLKSVKNNIILVLFITLSVMFSLNLFSFADTSENNAENNDDLVYNVEFLFALSNSGEQFTAIENIANIKTRTLLPLKNHILEVDFTSVSDYGLLSAVNLHLIFKNSKVADVADSVVLWAKRGDEYRVIDKRSEMFDIRSGEPLEFIVGSGNQLDVNNEYYTVNFKLPDVNVMPNHTVFSYGNNFAEINNFQSTISEVSLNIPDFNKGAVVDVVGRSTYNFLNMEVVQPKVYAGNYDNLQDIIDLNLKTLKNPVEVQLGINEFTVVYELDTTKAYDYAEVTTLVKPVKLNITSENITNVSINEIVLNDNQENVAYNFVKTGKNIASYVIKTYAEYSNNAEYYISFKTFKNNIEVVEDKENIVKAFLDHYDVMPIDGDISSELIGDTGYKADYSNGVDFTIFIDNVPHKVNVKLEQGTLNDNKFAPKMEFNGIEGGKFFEIAESNDSYVSNGFQTLFVIPNKVIDYKVAQLYWSATVGSVVSLNGVKVNSGDLIDLTQEPLAFTVATEVNGIVNIKNYWLVVKELNTSGAELFVNAAKSGINVKNEREVFFNDYVGKNHDIFLANVGNLPLTNLKVELTKAHNIRLDNYWTVGGEGNNTLLPFSTTELNKVDNIAKIRLMADNNGNANHGNISGVLIITADNVEPVIINLKGNCGNPRIITSADTVASHTVVKYVPYSFTLQTNNMYDWVSVRFDLKSGKLPDGMGLNATGEVYGIPTEFGEFTFTAEASFTSERFNFPSSSVKYKLIIKDCTDEFVDLMTDVGYAVQLRVPNITVGMASAVVFKSEGALSEFQDLHMNGVKLIRGVDYTAEEGSTILTVSSQILNKLPSGKVTIASEFRNSKGELKKSAQNFIVAARNDNIDSNNPIIPILPSYPNTTNVNITVPKHTIENENEENLDSDVEDEVVSSENLDNDNEYVDITVNAPDDTVKLPIDTVDGGGNNSDSNGNSVDNGGNSQSDTISVDYESEPNPQTAVSVNMAGLVMSLLGVAVMLARKR